MPASPMDLFGMTTAQVVAAARHHGVRGRGAAMELYRRAFSEGRLDPEAAGLGPAARRAWHDAFTADLPRVARCRSEPADQGGITEKLVLRTADGLEHETVHIPMGRGRSSQCLSTQVGCARACTFCETGRMGLLRDLTAGEIVAQVVAGRVHRGWRPRSLVFMGMGEPLDNADALVAALHVLTERRGLAYGQDRLTVCTVGHVEGIHRLRRLGWRRLELSLSLNAADDDQRAALMPIARRWSLAEVQRALVAYRQRANLAFGLHWCLLPGINDRRADARAIARFAAPLGRSMVHVIPYNPGSRPLTRPPTEEEVVRFVGWLRDEGLPVRRRIAKGGSVMAACGQLGNPALRRRNPLAT